MKTKNIKLFLPAILIFISSCAGIKFNQQAQNQNRTIHELTLEMVERSSHDYSENTALIQAIKDSYESAVAFETGRGKTNYPTISMWKQVDSWVNTDFVNLWKSQGKLGTSAIAEVKKRADKLFDYIINLEDNKVK